MGRRSARLRHPRGQLEHLALSGQVVEVRMMLHGLIRRLDGGGGDTSS